MAAVACGGGAARQRLTHTDGTQALSVRLAAEEGLKKRLVIGGAEWRRPSCVNKARGEGFCAAVPDTGAHDDGKRWLGKTG